jgi:hypothetical protein
MGLELSGGETAFVLFDKLSVNTLLVQGRITDIMPHGGIVDGKFAGCFFLPREVRLVLMMR